MAFSIVSSGDVIRPAVPISAPKSIDSYRFDDEYSSSQHLEKVKSFLKKLDIEQSDFESYLIKSINRFNRSSFSTSAPDSVLGTSPDSVLNFPDSPLSLFCIPPSLSAQQKSFIEQVASYLLDRVTDPFLNFIDPENKLPSKFAYNSFKQDLDTLKKNGTLLETTLADINHNKDYTRLIEELNKLDELYLTILKKHHFVMDSCKSLIDA